MARNIVLVGFMGTGKSAAARLLAQRLQRECVDVDEIIRAREGMEIADIFREKGEEYFRAAEKKAVRELSAEGGKIIACGGGVVLDPENTANLKKSGVLICLTARPEVILERTKACAKRPLLNAANPRARIAQLLRRRRPYYARADYTLDTSDLSLPLVVKKILNILKSAERKRA